tara:strand:- start:176 stop:754 length:579 start_codon:yes stop_codon:yes gene_type:complete
MNKILLSLFILLFLSKVTIAGEWTTIGQQESEIIFAPNFIINHQDLKFEKNHPGKQERWYFVSNNNYDNNPIYIGVQFYKVDANYFINRNRVYKPSKQMKYLWGESDYEWSGKRKSFKSINRVASYRKFEDTKYGDLCFIFGIHFSGAATGYVDDGFPWGILDGFFCRSNDFNETEIKNIVNSIGIKKLRPL